MTLLRDGLMELMKLTSSSVRFAPTILKVKLVASLAFNNVEFPPSWDFILKPISELSRVRLSCNTIRISVLSEDFAFKELQYMVRINSSINGTEKAPSFSLIFSNNNSACCKNSSAESLKSSAPFDSVITTSPFIGKYLYFASFSCLMIEIIG